MSPLKILTLLFIESYPHEDLFIYIPKYIIHST